MVKKSKPTHKGGSSNAKKAMKSTGRPSIARRGRTLHSASGGGLASVSRAADGGKTGLRRRSK
jgi:hypothetical protein